ncbi:hypothetical protein BDA96_09G026000 [Sorghum bicolor]|uniref:HTH myb-type domain-containing protein n=2 Tax=Sorghum bicolor TaxID=4558 RepID=A0A921QAK4_SORBI|nr:hypothetical protein BDA96_09G026000 [Sorghum bicolor]OQU77293.1 hypothetical protein SORBI_3009G024700 [Sorghum bicolor]
MATDDPLEMETGMLFLMGLKKYGRGDWRNISRNFVTSWTPTQVPSHAQKYFIRLNSSGKDKRRSSIHDITIVNLPDADTAGGGGNPSASPPSVSVLTSTSTTPSFTTTGCGPVISEQFGVLVDSKPPPPHHHHHFLPHSSYGNVKLEPVVNSHHGAGEGGKRSRAGSSERAQSRQRGGVRDPSTPVVSSQRRMGRVYPPRCEGRGGFVE